VRYGPFTVARFNFTIEHRPLGERGCGDVVQTIVSPVGAEMVYRQRLVFDYEEVETQSILQEHLQSSGLTARLGATLGAGLENIGNADLSSALESGFTESLRESRTVDTARTRRFTAEQEVAITLPGGGERAVLSVPYRKWAMSLRLHHTDYLKVTYQPSRGGLRVRRTKEPAITEDNSSHQNYTSSGLLLGEYRYWRAEGEAGKNLLSAEEHSALHINPLHVSFHPDESNDRKFYNLDLFASTPSLYKISNAAFPLKASQRIEEWTEESLLTLRDLEPDETAWIWEIRRRRNRKGKWR